jgi:protein transport protein SEC9
MKKFWKSDKDKDAAAAPSDNPYAQQANSQDPYAAGSQDPMAGYARGGGLPSGPRAGGGLPGRPVPRANGGYAAPPAPSQSSAGYGSSTASVSSTNDYSSSKYGSAGGGGYGSDKYGASGGYGSDRYDSQSQSSGLRGPGGYGGMGGGPGSGGAGDDDGANNRDALFGNKLRRGTTPQDNRYNQSVQAGPPPGARYGGGMGGGMGRNQSDSNRDALLGGARERMDAREQSDKDRFYGSGQSAVDGGSYGGYGEERELTEEEKHEMQIRAIHDKTRQVRQDDIDSLARTEQLGLQSLEIVQSSIARLGSQNDRLALAEKNLDKAISQNEETRVHVTDLKRINNGGMMSSLAKNPFAKGRRATDREQAAIRRREEAAQAEEETRAGQIAMNSQAGRIVQNIQTKRNKYEYEDEDEVSRDDLDQAYLQEGATDDDYSQEMEIERKLRSIEFISGGLNDASRQLNKYIDDSAPQLERTAKKVSAATAPLILSPSSHIDGCKGRESGYGHCQELPDYEGGEVDVTGGGVIDGAGSKCRCSWKISSDYHLVNCRFLVVVFRKMHRCGNHLECDQLGIHSKRSSLPYPYHKFIVTSNQQRRYPVGFDTAEVKSSVGSR